MKIAGLLCGALLFAVPALAETDVAEIRLGATPPPPPAVDRAKVKAVERFLAARQAGSLDRAAAPRARALLRMKERPDDAALFGSGGTTLAAFDFRDEAIATAEAGRFHVTVYLLFAGPKGQVVESRDESLSFRREGEGFVCTSLFGTNVIAWGQEGVSEAAESLGLSRELDFAEDRCREWTGKRSEIMAYSLADVQRGSDGRVVVECLRFRASLGRRGFGVSTAPIVLTRTSDSIRVETD